MAMLVAAQNPSVALRTQTQTGATVPSAGQRKQQLDMYPSTPVTVPPLLPPPLRVSPSPMALPLPLPVPIQMPAQVTAPVPVQLPSVAPAFSSPPEPVQQEVIENVVVQPQERLLAAQLAHLASQHHTSEYNRLKFGNRGSPNAYMPLSLQAPAHVRQLRARQASNANQRAWWTSERNGCGLQEKSLYTVPQPQMGETNAPALMSGPPLDISHEIYAAISSQMVSTHITKTSQSHPINISTVIPCEALPAIASRIVRSSAPSPVLFFLPENCHLNHVTAAPTHSPSSRTGNPLYLPTVRPLVPVTWAQQGNTNLENALNGELAFPPIRPPFVPSWEQYTLRPPVEAPFCTFPMTVPAPPSPPRGVVRRRHRHGRAMSAPPAVRTLKVMQRRVPSYKELRQCLPRNRSSPEVPMKRLDGTPLVTPQPSLPIYPTRPEQAVNGNGDEPSNNANANGHGLMLPPPPPPLTMRSSPPDVSIPTVDSASLEDGTTTQRLGNLYLSSCPGKKVRLSGPVKGRSAICRDLRADLSRMKELGVGCVICCLDDTELDFLGASWVDYSRVTNELGLDVLRIPMPEGLAPLSPASLDSNLKEVIEAYTLRGIAVLAHCRGGVGRAGLVACCWMIKLGLVGWKDPQICASSCSEHSSCRQARVGDGQNRACAQAHSQPQSRQFTLCAEARSTSNVIAGPVSLGNVPRVCRETLRLVERVLAVIRRRRSLKAIETYEQVRFLVDFIEYLDSQC